MGLTGTRLDALGLNIGCRSLNDVTKGVKLVITIRRSHSLISGEAKEPGRLKVRAIGSELDLLHNQKY